MQFYSGLMVRIAYILLVILVPTACIADGIPNENICYDPSIKTIQVFKEGFELSPPIIQINSTERISIQFDDLSPDIKRYKFTILHCDADWQLSADLTVADYIDGYREENIDQYEYSYNTMVRYTHFRTTFPTDNMRPKVSGNYLLLVYEDDPSQLAFTMRFMVVESSPVVATGKIVQGSEIASRLSRQQVDFVVHLNGFQVLDVDREIKIILMQNGRWDNTLRLSKPRFARTDELDYRYDESISFSGGNQFRNFDIKSLQYQSERIARIAYDTTNQVFLLADQPRTYKQYAFEKDLNGCFYIKSEDHAERSNTEADYAWVHFYLPFPAMITNGTFHILGGLTYWQTDNSNRMYFNPEHKGYELNLFLKQGYYNYLYVFRENGKTTADESFIEGSHWETENDYTLYVYYHETGSLYDRLIAVNFLNTIQL
jgi:hypothetical protein